MNAPQSDHEKLRAYQDALKFAAWVESIIERLPHKLAARDQDQLDRASTSIVLNIAEGNGKRSHPDRCRYFDISRGSALESAACLDVLVARKKLDEADIVEGKAILVGVVSLVAGLIARFGGNVQEDPAPYGSGLVENEND
ncbi:S23 ribosomal protein [uncultured Defluviicoccus sp.]|uniref:S23 ribosomal protein n=1 Tax=metagenome TaxID=256318 RepID=A0A380TK27_9ZZZZ|nr:S23 ribosomal protein [uncultured Defluviicoccus sp.]